MASSVKASREFTVTPPMLPTICLKPVNEVRKT